jgi:hypothetical protein
MSKRIDSSWIVLESIESREHDRGVDLFRRPDGTFGFEEFRRDFEDGGEWTPMGHYSVIVHSSKAAAMSAALAVVGWLTVNAATSAR